MGRAGSAVLPDKAALSFWKCPPPSPPLLESWELSSG